MFNTHFHTLSFKKLNDKATLPQYQTEGSAGFDLHACIEKSITIKPNEVALISTGLSSEFTNQYELQIRSRSGLALKNQIIVLNAPGTIDSDYRGEIKIILYNLSKQDFIVKCGDRIAQGIFCPIVKAHITEVSNLEETTRGEGGFGSTGV